MGRLTGHRRQDVVYWAKSSKSKFNEPTVSSGVALKVRWIDKQEESLDANNQVIKTDVTVKVDRSIAIGSIFWKGKLRDLPSPVSDTTNLYQVVTSREVPNIKNRSTRYTVGLIRYSDTMPTVV